MYIDTHCHLTSEDYDDIDLVIKENIDNNVSKIIVSGCDMESIKEGLILSKKHPSVYLTLGFHPSEVNNYDLDYLKGELNNPKVVGLGEIGLDYHYGKEDINKQKDLFRKQLDIATELNIPVVIHSRDATKDTINILKEYNLKGVIHCFSGSLETAKEYIKMGYLLGIGGVVTFKNSKLYKVVEGVSLENIVLETDSPYLTPEPDRGKKNSSKYIPIIAKKVSEIKKISEEKVMKTTTDNATKLFDLK